MQNNNTFIFLRHADTEKDPSVNAAFWGLSEKGILQAEEASLLPIMNVIDFIYVSEEIKTSLTAEPIAKKLNNKELHVSAFFDEVKRGDAFLTKEEFELEKKRQLVDLSYKAFNGESGIDALARFKQGISDIDKQYTNKKILIVTHGTVLNLYFADLLHAEQTLPERWRATGFCAYGIVEDGTVTKDIV